MLIREKYLAKIRSFYHTESLIKIIYGIFKLVNDDLRFDIINLLNVVLNLVFLIKT